MLIRRYSSPLGEIILCAHEGALRGLWFAGQKYEQAGVDLHLKEAAGDGTCLVETVSWLDNYFEAKQPGHLPALSLTGTDFQRKVWHMLLEIPYGKCCSYGALAERIGCRSARAVGTAVGRNPISLIVPCHRVLGAGGQLTGYAGGLERKKALLVLEREALLRWPAQAGIDRKEER